MELKKQVQAKGWFLTFPRCPVTPQAALEYLKEQHAIVEYIIAQEEHQDGSLHLHAFIKLEKKVTWSPKRFDLPEHHGNYQVAKSWQAVRKYVTKGGNYISSFSVESAQAKKAKLSKQVLEVGLRQAVDEGLISLRDLPGYVKAVDIYRSLRDPYDHTDVRGHWYVGAPGTGKSRTARERYPGAYLKAQNKWWDGYQGQEAVILDDLDKGGACLGHYLKIWADRYACTGETKGGHVQLRHMVLVITSNYRPEELWPDDKEMCDAISRRFKVTVFHTL